MEKRPTKQILVNRRDLEKLLEEGEEVNLDSVADRYLNEKMSDKELDVFLEVADWHALGCSLLELIAPYWAEEDFPDRIPQEEEFTKAYREWLQQSLFQEPEVEDVACLVRRAIIKTLSNNGYADNLNHDRVRPILQRIFDMATGEAEVEGVWYECFSHREGFEEAEILFLERH